MGIGLRTTSTALALGALLLACGSDDGGGGGGLTEPTGSPPSFSSTPPTTADHNRPYEYRVQATDPDGETVTIRATQLPSWLSFDPSGLLLSGTAEWENIGAHTVSLQASDGQSTTVQAFSLIVGKGEIICDQDFDDPSQSSFILPFIPGEIHQIVEGYCSTSQNAAHHNWFAYDFDLAVGDTILTSRGGVVRSVREDRADGNGSSGGDNFVLVEHADGTVMQYGHLTRDGALVEPGDTLLQGEPIGLAGSSGTDGGPRLHVALFRAAAELERRATLPLNFRNAQGPSDSNRGLVVQERYTALPFAEAAAVQRVRNVGVVDHANNGDGRDLKVTFTPPVSDAGVLEYRVFVVPSSDGAAFDVDAATGLSSDRYAVVARADEAIEIVLGEAAIDSGGAAIQEGAPYRIFVMSVADGRLAGISALAQSQRVVTLAITNLVSTLTAEIPGGSGGMAVDADGNIYAADFGAALNSPPGTVIYKVTPAGDFSVWATGLVGASGNAFDSQGNLFQSNIGASIISRITPDGTVSTFATQGFANPVGIAIDDDDNLYVANCGNNTIRFVTSEGVSTQFAASGLFACPNGIALADDGNLYVANFGNGSVIKIDPAGVATSFVTLPGGNLGHLTWANGVLYVVARSAHQLYQVQLDGTVTRLAGTGQRGLVDGPALEARLSLTNDVAVSPDGKTLYFNDVVSQTGTNILSPMVVRKLQLEVGN